MPYTYFLDNQYLRHVETILMRTIIHRCMQYEWVVQGEDGAEAEESRSQTGGFCTIVQV